MNTIRIKGSFKKMNAFMKDKEPVFNDDRFDLPLLSYYDYLLKFDQSLSTVLKKLQVAYVFFIIPFRQ